MPGSHSPSHGAMLVKQSKHAEIKEQTAKRTTMENNHTGVAASFESSIVHTAVKRTAVINRLPNNARRVRNMTLPVHRGNTQRFIVSVSLCSAAHMTLSPTSAK